MNLRCVCGYEYEDEVVYPEFKTTKPFGMMAEAISKRIRGEHKTLRAVKGDEPFIPLFPSYETGFTAVGRRHKSYAFACPKCGTIKFDLDTWRKENPS